MKKSMLYLYFLFMCLFIQAQDNSIKKIQCYINHQNEFLFEKLILKSVNIIQEYSVGENMKELEYLKIVETLNNKILILQISHTKS